MFTLSLIWFSIHTERLAFFPPKEMAERALAFSDVYQQNIHDARSIYGEEIRGFWGIGTWHQVWVREPYERYTSLLYECERRQRCWRLLYDAWMASNVYDRWFYMERLRQELTPEEWITGRMPGIVPVGND